MHKIERIDSWKNIAKYIDRDIATCMKWAKLYDFPVYRIDNKAKKSCVFAYKSEIDKWFENRRNS